MGHIFISYSREDSSLMESVLAALCNANIGIWVDQASLKAGVSWGREIQSAIETCDATVILASPSASESDYVERELLYAMDHDRTIYPVLIRGDRRSSMPFHIYASQYIDATGDLFEEGMHKLISDISTNGEQAALVGAQGHRSTTVLPPLPIDWTSAPLRTLATITRPPFPEPEESPDGQYPLYTLSEARTSATDQFTYEGTYILLPAAESGYPLDARPSLRIVTGRFAVRRSLLVIKANHEYMTEYLAWYLSANIDWPSMLVGGLFRYLSVSSLDECQVVTPSTLADMESLCRRIASLDAEIKRTRRYMEIQMNLLVELETAVRRSLLPSMSDEVIGGMQTPAEAHNDMLRLAAD